MNNPCFSHGLAGVVFSVAIRTITQHEGVLRVRVVPSDSLCLPTHIEAVCFFRAPFLIIFRSEGSLFPAVSRNVVVERELLSSFQHSKHVFVLFEMFLVLPSIDVSCLA
jgi:hypothetical protein